MTKKLRPDSVLVIIGPDGTPRGIKDHNTGTLASGFLAIRYVIPSDTGVCPTCGGSGKVQVDPRRRPRP